MTRPKIRTKFYLTVLSAVVSGVSVGILMYWGKATLTDLFTGIFDAAVFVFVTSLAGMLLLLATGKWKAPVALKEQPAGKTVGIHDEGTKNVFENIKIFGHQVGIETTPTTQEGQYKNIEMKHPAKYRTFKVNWNRVSGRIENDPFLRVVQADNEITLIGAVFLKPLCEYRLEIAKPHTKEKLMAERIEGLQFNFKTNEHRMGWLSFTFAANELSTLSLDTFSVCIRELTENAVVLVSDNVGFVF